MRSALYEGTLLHARSAPARNVFRYPVCFYVLDLDELPELDRRLALFGYNRPNVLSFRDGDHLGDDRLQPARGRVAVEVADRVEDVAQQAQVREQHDAPAGQVDAAAGEELHDVLLHRPGRVAQVVGVTEGEDVGPVVAEQREAPVELGQLVEVEGVEADRVAEDVARRSGARVQERPLVEG